jgi:DNA mismatch endonuclease (patch repair protein)
VHGCFWHHHAECVRATTPTRNREFWIDKFEANKRRDQTKTRLLKAMGLDVVTIWECESCDPGVVKRRIAKLARRQ